MDTHHYTNNTTTEHSSHFFFFKFYFVFFSSSLFVSQTKQQNSTVKSVSRAPTVSNYTLKLNYFGSVIYFITEQFQWGNNFITHASVCVCVYCFFFFCVWWELKAQFLLIFKRFYNIYLFVQIYHSYKHSAIPSRKPKWLLFHEYKKKTTKSSYNFC